MGNTAMQLMIECIDKYIKIEDNLIKDYGHNKIILDSIKSQKQTLKNIKDISIKLLEQERQQITDAVNNTLYSVKEKELDHDGNTIFIPNGEQYYNSTFNK